MHAIIAEGLTKRYGTTTALDDFDLAVPPGTVCGLLGPNGAGKTTAVRILSTLLRPDGGSARVAGHDVVTGAAAVRASIGLLGQHAAVDEVLGGRQNLVLFGRLHHLSRNAARERADALLTRFGLDDTGHRPVAQYSGGMRRRLDLAASLILAPPVLFLDEPTTGLDPRGRGDVWQAVRGLVGQGTTVLLTTQYLEEADQLADAICVVGAGRVLAHDTPDRLKSQVGGDRIEVVVQHVGDLPRAAALVARVAGTDAEVDADLRRVGAAVTERMAALTSVVALLEAERIDVEDVALRRPTLDEVFLSLTAPRSPADHEVPA